MRRVLLIGVAAVAACGDGQGTPSGQNGAPTRPTVTIAPANPLTDDDLVATASGSTDPDGDALTYAFRWERDGDPQPGLTSATVPASATKRGELWTVVAVANDGKVDGPPGEAEVVVRNTPPSVTVAIAPSAPRNEDNLVATATARDADGDEVTLAYAWKVDGIASERNGNTIPAEDTTPGQRWVVTVTPRDRSTAGMAATATVVVGNAPPMVSSLRIGPDPATSATIISAVTGTVSDADGDSVRLTFRWTADGTRIQEDLRRSLLPGMARRGQRIQATVTPNDGVVDGAMVSSNEIVLTNSGPVIGTLAIDPLAGDIGTTFRCLPQNVVDYDMDPISFRITWYVNEVPVASSSTALAAPAFRRGDRIRCEATPNDGLVDGAVARSPVLLVRNAAPTLQSVTIGPATPREGDRITAVVTGGADVDGDPVTFQYAWAVNGAVVSTSTTIDSSRFDKRQTIQLTVYPYDGVRMGTGVMSNVLTAVNTPPRTMGVEILPAPARTADTLRLNAIGWVDPDPNDARTFEVMWMVNGAVVATTQTLPGTAFARGDVVQAIAVPRDSDDAGPPVTSPPITIVNSPPSAPRVAITPAMPDERSPLACTITSTATDPDGDRVTYTYAWQRNGMAVAITSSIAPASATEGGETWACLATPSDGMAAGPAGRAETYVAARCDSLRLDGTDDLISATASARFAYGARATVEAWVRWDGNAGTGFDRAIFTHRPSSNAMSLGVFGSDTSGCACPGRAAGQPYFRWGDSCTRSTCIRASTALPANAWVHVAGVWNQGRATLFVGGRAVATTTAAAAIQAVAPGSAIGIGAIADGSGAHFGGVIGEVRVSTSAVYLADFTPADRLGGRTSAIAHWQLDEGAGMATADAAPGALHPGTLRGGPAWIADGPACGFDSNRIAVGVATAFCRHRTRCEPAWYGYLGTNEAGCIAEQTSRLASLYGGRRGAVQAGRMRLDQQRFDACLAAYNAADCDRGLDPGACEWMTGTQAVGAPCGDDLECVPSAFCPLASLGMCGACAPRTPAGGSCATTRCAPNTTCLTVGTSRLCIPVTADIGQPCGTVPTGLCRGRLSCVGFATFTCQRAGTAGAACDQFQETAPDCNIFRDQYCVNGVCQGVTWVGVGASCVEPSLCDRNGECFGQTCMALPAAGQPCSPQDQCAAGSFCDQTRLCRAERAAGMTCTAQDVCADGNYCINGSCQPYAWTRCN